MNPTAPGVGAFTGRIFVRFESLETRDRPIGQPQPEYGDPRFECISWTEGGWKVSSGRRHLVLDFISENHTLVAEANRISRTQGILEAGRYLGKMMPPCASNKCGEVGRLAQDEFFTTARDASLRSTDKLRYFCDSEFVPHVFPDFEGIFGGPKMVHAWGWVVCALFSGEVAERGVIRGSDADATSDTHLEEKGYMQLSDKQAERIIKMLRDAESGGQDPCQWHRPAESTIAKAALGSVSVHCWLLGLKPSIPASCVPLL